MSAMMWLAIARVGVSLLGAGESLRAARAEAEQQRYAVRAEAEQQRYAARYQGLTERTQIRSQTRAQTQQLSREYQSTMAAQRAGLAHAGVQGGKTAQLMRAKSGAEYYRARGRIAGERAAGITDSKFRERVGIADSKFREKFADSVIKRGLAQEKRQIGLNLLGSTIGTATEFRSGQEAREAQQSGQDQQAGQAAMQYFGGSS